MASCSQVDSLFQAYIDGELGYAEKSILELHLHECGHCGEEMGRQNACNARVFEALAEHRLSWGLRSSVLAHLPEMDPPVKGGSHPTDPQYVRKKARNRSPWMLVAAAALLVGVAVFLYGRSGTPGAAMPPVGMVTFWDGEAVLRKSMNAKDYEAVKLKSLVAEGDELNTLADGRLAMALIGGSTVKVSHATTLRVDDYRRVRVDRGLTYFEIGHDKRRFYVHTPAGEILVTGTAFLLEVGDAATTVTVTDGDILVRNSVGQIAVSKGNQLVFKNDMPLESPRPVDTASLMAWADAIVPDPGAIALFRQTLELRRSLTAPIPAEPIHLLRDLKERVIDDMLVEWKPDGRTAGHCGYIIHVADSDGKLLMLDTLDSELFNNPALDHAEIAVPNGPIRGVDVIHIRLIPDHTPGNVEVDMTVSAIAR